MKKLAKSLSIAVEKNASVDADHKVALEILRMRDVMQITGMGRTTIYDAIARGAFPKSIKITSKSIGFYSIEIYAWLQNPTGYRSPEAA